MNEPGTRNQNGAPDGYGIAARLFHWATVLIIVIQIPAGVAMTSEPLAGYADPLFILHKGLGSILLVLVVLRILWRLTHRPPPFPDHMPPLEKRIAGRTHVALYFLVFVMAASGYLRTVADDFPIELLDAIGIPPLVSGRPGLAQIMLVVHQFSVFALVALIAVHVGAVLQHHLIQKDGVLSRMWPPLRRPNSGEETGKGGGGA